MSDSYKIDVISEEEKQQYINNAKVAINRIHDEINRLKSEDNTGNTPINSTKPEEITFYIRTVLNIPLRAKQEDKPTANESYYYEFIPIKKQTVLISLRDTDHIHDESVADSQEDKVHPNLRATTIVVGSGQFQRKSSKPHVCNGLSIQRTSLIVPTEIFGTKQQVITFLNALLYLFKEGRFGNPDRNKKQNENMKTIKELLYCAL